MRSIGWMALVLLAGAAPAMADVTAGSAAWAKGDYRTAVEQWRGPATAGDPVAAFNLGQAYKLGRGVPVDPAQAQNWFRRAAEKGLPQGEDNYGLSLFQAGQREQAAPWLEKSAARGEPRCQLVLGTMLFNGDGVPRDYPRAYALVSRAAAAGLTSASETLAQMDGYITPADREHGTALAQQYASQASSRPPVAQPGVVRVADVPPSRVPSDVPNPPRPGLYGHGRTPPPPEPTRVATIQPVPTASPRPAPTPRPPRPAPMPVAVATARGSFKAQLGAFHDRGNAETLWARVKGKMAGASPAYVAAGGVTRLQATGFASRADAEAACKRAGVAGCIVTGG